MAVGVMIGLMAAPAAADKPVNFQDSDSFWDVNPCTGEDMYVTLFADVFIHEHPNNFVVRVVRTGTTSTGDVMDHGIETQVANGNVEAGRFTDQWRNEDGSKFVVQGVFVFNLNRGEVQVDRFSLRCLGAPNGS
jgi:hypothetical protein